MASSVRTRCFILDRPQSGHDALSLSVCKDAYSTPLVEHPCSVGLGMTNTTSRRALVYHAPQIPWICREHGATFVIEYPEPFNPGFARDASDGLIKPFSIVFQHLVPGTVLDEIADLVGALQDQLLGPATLQLQAPVPVHSEDRGCAHHQAQP